MIRLLTDLPTWVFTAHGVARVYRFRWKIESLLEVLMQIALHANPKSLQKHTRGAKPSAKKGYVSGAVARRHVATAQVLKDGLVKSQLKRGGAYGA